MCIRDRPNFSPCRISAITHILETEFMPIAMNKGLALTITNQTDTIVLTDKECILQIGNNLLSNAIKFTENEMCIRDRADPDDIYATLDWDTNPPINGFYETMMSLTPERRKELRELATRHQEKRQHVTGVKAAPEQETRQPETQPEAAATPAALATETAATSLFPGMEAAKPKEEAPDLTPRPYHRTPEMHLREGSLVASLSLIHILLEPSAGVGAFVDAVLDNKPDADIMAFEKALMTGKILKHLHPDQKVRVCLLYTSGKLYR